MKELFTSLGLQKALIYVNISYNGRIIKSLSSRRDFIERSVVHIFDDHIVIIHLHNYTHMAVCWRKSWAMIDDDCSGSWIITSWHSLFFCIFDPVFCISSPSDIFIFRDKTGTISPNKITASFVDFEGKRIPPIGDNWWIFYCHFNRRL